nr:excinuclease ABC subunit UvrC [Dissulfurirhabdus thermomarina]
MDLEGPDVLARVPARPGVYLFRAADGIVLYVGKAKALRQRLAAYLRPSAEPAPKTALMLARARRVELVLTGSEKEALLLEAALIKEHRPRYNVRLRDDKAYPFLRLSTGHPFPRLTVVRRRRPDGALYFGPYPSAGAVRATLRLLAPAFRLRSCSDHAFRHRRRPCLQYQIGRCSAPCVGRVSREAYAAQVREARLFLEGRTAPLLRQLRRRMAAEAEALRFEAAAELRDRIRAVESLVEGQAVVAGQGARWDVVGLAREGERAAAAVLRVRAGVLRGQETLELAGPGDVPDGEIVAAFLRDYYGAGRPVPPEVLVPVLPEEADVLAEGLREMAGRKVRLARALRGRRRRLAEMATRNAREALAAAGAERAAWTAVADRLVAVLGLRRRPRLVEGVDIATTGGEGAVAGLVAFRDGHPFRDGYRIYGIRTVAGMDDFAMIREAVERRLARAGEPGRGGWPDLLLVDGGRGQLGMAEAALAAAGAAGRVELVALAKDRDGGGERLYRPGRPEPIRLDRADPALLFLQRVRDEAHGFGNRFHGRRRDRGRLASSLRDVPGVGPGWERRLLARFGSIAGLRAAGREALRGVPGLPAALADRIYDHLHGGEG